MSGFTTRAPHARLRLALTVLAGTTLGLLLPAFYLLPAAYERPYVQITLATIQGMRPQDHFLFHRMPTATPDDLFHNAVVQTASIVSLLLLAAIAVAFSTPWSSKTMVAPEPAPGLQRLGLTSGAATFRILLPLTLLIAFLLTPPSLVLWNHTPQLSFLQFPWRLNALLAVILLTLISGRPIITGARPGLSWAYALAPLVLAVTLILPTYLLFHQPCDATDTPIARAALFHTPLGTEPTDEYTPASADNDALHPSAPWWYTCLSTRPDLNQPSPAGHGQAPTHLEADLPCPALVVLNRRAYPGWLVTVNRQPITPTQPGRDDGLITFLAPAGHLSLSVNYLRTPDRKLGLLLSALALLIAAALFRKPTPLDTTVAASSPPPPDLHGAV